LDEIKENGKSVDNVPHIAFATNGNGSLILLLLLPLVSPPSQATTPPSSPHAPFASNPQALCSAPGPPLTGAVLARHNEPFSRPCKHALLPLCLQRPGGR